MLKNVVMDDSSSDDEMDIPVELSPVDDYGSPKGDLRISKNGLLDTVIFSE